MTPGRPPRTRIDLGLCLLSLIRVPGRPLTLEDIAAWCDCSPSTIHAIEQRALAKARDAFPKTPPSPR